MSDFLHTTTGKVTAFLVFYIPFFCAIFFNAFDGRGYQSPIGECCIPMEGVVIAGYGLLTVWVFVPAFLVYGVYRLRKVFSIRRSTRQNSSHS